MQQRQEITWSPEQIARFWDYQSQRSSADGNYFSFARGAQIAKRTLGRIAPRRSPRILDLGCGTGHFLKHLSEARSDMLLYGIDFSPESIRIAQEACQSHIPSQHLVSIEGYPSPLQDASFDAVYSIEVVEHLSDIMLDSMVNEAHRLLKHGGYLVVTTPNDENLEMWHTCCPNCNSTFHIWQHVRSWTTRSLSQFMSTHGFTEISAKATFLEPLHIRLIIWVARKFGIVKRQPPHIIAIYQK
jgi:ubiquinone/menaquinone biosynthesis C-methylase UbiE